MGNSDDQKFFKYRYDEIAVTMDGSNFKQWNPNFSKGVEFFDVMGQKLSGVWDAISIGYGFGDAVKELFSSFSRRTRYINKAEKEINDFCDKYNGITKMDLERQFNIAQAKVYKAIDDSFERHNGKKYDAIISHALLCDNTLNRINRWPPDLLKSMVVSEDFPKRQSWTCYYFKLLKYDKRLAEKWDKGILDKLKEFEKEAISLTEEHFSRWKTEVRAQLDEAIKQIESNVPSSVVIDYRAYKDVSERYVGNYDNHFFFTENIKNCISSLRFSDGRSSENDMSEIHKKETAKIIGELDGIQRDLRRTWDDKIKEKCDEVLSYLRTQISDFLNKWENEISKN
jgi:hypothetical protein